jgi:CHAT domain-containing protein/tetratricopeptide (TPR) repeat protein
MRLLPVLLLLALLTPPVARARARAAAPPDTVALRLLTDREPFRTLGLARRSTAMDSVASAELAGVLARGERDSAVVARALEDAVEAACVANRASDPRVGAWMARALAIRTRAPGADSVWFARALRVAGELARRRRELGEAERLNARALGLLDRALPPLHPEIGMAARQLAFAASQLGHGRYVAVAQRAVDIAAARYGADDPRVLPGLSVLAAQQNLAGDQVRALANLERVRAGLERTLGPAHPDVDRARYNVATVSMRVGDLVRARGLLEEVLAYESSAAVVDSLRLSMSLGAMLECLNDLGDTEEALAVERRLGAVPDRFLKPGDPLRGNLAHERARLFARAGRAREAVALFDSACAAEARANDSLSALPILFERAGALRQTGDTAAALRGLELAGRMAERAGRAAPSFFEAGLLWARCLDDAGRPAEALAWLEPSLARADEVLGPRSPWRARLLLEQARALGDLGDPRAGAVALEAAESTAELLRTAARGFPDRQALLFARETGLGLDPLLTLAAAGRLDDAQRAAAFERVVEARSLVLDETARRLRAARGADDPRAAALLDSLGEARAVLARWLVRAEGGREQDSLRAAARERIDRAERALADLGLAPAALPASSPLTRLAPGDALVSYMEYAAPAGGARSERRLLAFVARPGRAPAVVALGRAREVDERVARWRADVARGLGSRADAAVAERRARESGAALRERVWDPLVARLAGASCVRMVADGALHLVDLAALPAPGGGYLVERAPRLARLGAERDLALAAEPAPAPGSGLVVVGGADFDLAAPADGEPLAARRGVPVCEDFRAVRFGPLPGTRREVEEVAARWRALGRPVVALTGAGAAEASVKAAAPRGGTLHIATHGFFLGRGCAGEAGATRGIGGLGPADASAASSATPGLESALRLAGLALSGANQRARVGGADDGVLTAEEISALDLGGVREVVLSACDSGVGDIAAGEGVLGLQRAFRLAGARALVMSLWPVDDQATRAWMEAYYDARLARAASVSEAVRDAARSRLRALRAAGRPTPPAAWAGFIPLGD